MMKFERMVIEAIATKKKDNATFIACFLMNDGSKKIFRLPEWMEELAPSAWYEAIHDLCQEEGKLIWIGNEPFFGRFLKEQGNRRNEL